jgi:hypothetical protein
MMTRTTQLAGLALGGLTLVLGARWALPQAPPMYEGITVPPPYQYCDPPANLKSSNKTPEGGGGDLQVVNGLNRLTTVETADRQVVAFFAQGVFKLRSPLHVTINPICTSPPSPPRHSALAGNVIRIQASPVGTGALASPPPLDMPAQILLRVPPVSYNTVRIYYDGNWHDTQFGAQIDLVNLSLTHFGDVAAFNDTSLTRRPRPPPGISWVAILEALLVVIALLIIGAGIIAQRRRTQAGNTR